MDAELLTMDQSHLYKRQQDDERRCQRAQVRGGSLGLVNVVGEREPGAEDKHEAHDVGLDPEYGAGARLASLVKPEVAVGDAVAAGDCRVHKHALSAAFASVPGRAALLTWVARIVSGKTLCRK
jgi:hypothetical protein